MGLGCLVFFYARSLCDCRQVEASVFLCSLGTTRPCPAEDLGVAGTAWDAPSASPAAQRGGSCRAQQGRGLGRGSEAREPDTVLTSAPSACSASSAVLQPGSVPQVPLLLEWKQMHASHTGQTPDTRGPSWSRGDTCLAPGGRSGELWPQSPSEGGGAAPRGWLWAFSL